MTHKLRPKGGRLAGVDKQALFASVYAGLPVEEQTRVDRLVARLAEIPKIGPMLAREVFVSAAMELARIVAGQEMGG